MSVTLYGASYSVYVRIARLALEEKGVSYTLEEIDIFAEGGPPSEHLARHPFGKIPAFEHDGFTLYEAGAIARYVDRSFDGPSLMPHEPHAEARANQIVSIADSYAYRSLVWGVYTEAVADLRDGTPKNVAAIDDALARSRQCLSEIARLRGRNAWLAGDDISLADLHLAPMVSYFLVAAEAQPLWNELGALHDWWERLKARPSMIGTRANDMVA